MSNRIVAKSVSDSLLSNYPILSEPPSHIFTSGEYISRESAPWDTVTALDGVRSGGIQRRRKGGVKSRRGNWQLLRVDASLPLLPLDTHVLLAHGDTDTAPDYGPEEGSAPAHAVGPVLGDLG